MSSSLGMMKFPIYVSTPSEKYEFVSWDDDIPNIWKNQKHVPNHQPVFVGL